MQVLASIPKAQVGDFLEWLQHRVKCLRTIVLPFQISFLPPPLLPSERHSTLQVVLFYEDEPDARLLHVRHYTHMAFDPKRHLGWASEFSAGGVEHQDEDFVLWRIE